MANCAICEKRIGLFDEVTLENTIRGVRIGSPISVCDTCSKIMRKLKDGDIDAYLKIHEIVDKKEDRALADFINLWEKVPDAITSKNMEVLAEELRKEEMLRRERDAALPNILISSGFSFEGYRIVKYSGYISGDDAVQIPRSGVFGGNNGKNLTDALVRIRTQALKELKEAAFDLGCNAVIGVDFDYITLEPESVNITGGTLYEPYIICVTANGNAVIIEKIE